MSNTVKLPTCPKCGAPIPIEAPQGLCPKCVLLGAATATEQGVPATATSEIPSIERIAAAFPQLEILELIGRGGMGFVFKARQPHLDRFVALKLLPDKLAKDPQFAERFNREGRVLAKLNHPNITSVFDFGHASAGTPAGQPKTPNPKPGTSDGGFYYLTMEYVDGVNLRQAMRAGRFSPAEALALVPKVCEALQYAHEQGVLHRDIKPENILLDAKGRVKIADFGIAKLVGEDQPNITLTNTGAALGTPHYMAPEQLEKPATVDHRADIYSLGVVFYEMLTGELPIGRFAAPSSKTPVNATVDDVVFRTLEKDRERRFQSAGEMKTQVEHLGAGSFEQPDAEEDDEAPRSWLEAVYSMRLVGWFLAAFCLVNFLLPHFTRLGNSLEDTFMVGLSRPWLVNVPLTDAQGVVTREWRWVPSASSFASGVFGLALLGALLLWRTRRKASEPADAAIALASSTSLWHRVAPALLSVLLLFSLIAVLSYERREFEMHGRQRSSFRLGWPDPWVAIGELRADGSLGSSVNLATSSMLFGAIAVVCAVILLRLSRTSLEPRLKTSHRFSHWSIYGALSVGLSLPVPFAAIVGLLTGMGGVGPGELWLALGSVALPGLGGTLLGWLALNEIRESRGRVKGLPLAMFATLFWPLTILGALTIGVPMFLSVPGGEPSVARTFGRFLVLLLPAAVIAFGFWTIHAAARWASQQQVPQQRGVLKWVFIVVLVVGMGVVMVTKPSRHTPATIPTSAETSPMIQFTFTSVELREEGNARWLTMEYVEQVRGDCQHTFRYDARVPGFAAQTRMDSGLSDAKSGFAPVQHQRVMWKLPDSLPQSDALSLRDLVAKQWIGKSTAIEPGDERVLFKSLVPGGDTLAAAVGVRVASSQVLKTEATRQIQLAGPDQHGLYLFLHTDSEQQGGDYFVSQLKRPDGRIDEVPVGTHAIRQNGKAVVTKSFSWPMALFESNRVTTIATDLHEKLDGRVVSIEPRKPLRIFTATNDRAGVIEGSVELRTESDKKPGVSLSIASTHTWPQMFMAYLRVGGSFGYTLQGVGVYGDGVEVDTHTSISRDGAGNSSCRWNLPPGFAKAEADDIARQLEAIKNSAPDGLRIAPGQRVPVFALTNQAGTVFRGYFELPLTTGTEPVTAKRNTKKSFDTAATRQIEINRLRQSGQNLWLTTDSKFPLGDSAVGLLKRADGRIEEQLPSSYAIRRDGKVATTTSLYWSMALFESNRIAEIINSLGEMYHGRVVTISAFQPLSLFTATNDRGGVISGSIELRTGSSVSDDAPATSLAIIATHTWPTMLSADFRIIGPLGYAPYGVGVYGDGAEVETHTVIYRHSASRSDCRWNLPPGFSKPEAEAIARQIETLKDSAPNGLRVRPGERVPVFALTNQAGTVFRGYFELPAMNEVK